MNQIKLRMLVGALLLALGLTACSGPPSNAEVEEIMLSSTAQMLAFMQEEGEPAVDPREIIHGVSRDGCERTGDNSYECLVTVRYNPQYAVFGEQITQRMRFTKTSDGWYGEDVQ